jgi:hypothetical protein
MVTEGYRSLLALVSDLAEASSGGRSGDVGSGVEIGSHLTDLQVGSGDLVATQRDQLRGPRHALGKSIDVDIGAFELAQDGVEFV